MCSSMCIFAFYEPCDSHVVYDVPALVSASMTFNVITQCFYGIQCYHKATMHHTGARCRETTFKHIATKSIHWVIFSACDCVLHMSEHICALPHIHHKWQQHMKYMSYDITTRPAMYIYIIWGHHVEHIFMAHSIDSILTHFYVASSLITGHKACT